MGKERDETAEVSFWDAGDFLLRRGVTTKQTFWGRVKKNIAARPTKMLYPRACWLSQWSDRPGATQPVVSKLTRV